VPLALPLGGVYGMVNFDLLTAVQPEQGWYAVVGIQGGKRQQEIVETREEFDYFVELFKRRKWDVFYGVAKFSGEPDANGKRHRTKQDVVALKAFWLDIDCGSGKSYPTQNDGIAALQEFCKNVGLSKPILVNSGNGLHAYWPLKEAITREEWEPVAKRLKEVCALQRLHVDNNCFEAARILRVPGTFNYKSGEPLPVSVVVIGKVTTLEAIREALGAKECSVFPFKRSGRPLSALAQQIQNSIENEFSLILGKGEKGCRQLVAAYEEREHLSEPRWFDALSIAKFCKDRDTAIHKLSEGHPDYDPAATEQKIQHILGPHSCEQFESNNPGGCTGCPHKGKIKSPIVLGRVVAEAPKNNVIIEVDEFGRETRYNVPEYPFPYFRGEKGGVWRKSEVEEEKPTLVYPYDLYVVKRMRDPNEGGVVLIRSHTPKDGVEEFTITNAKISDPTEVRKELARNDILLNKKNFDLLVDYIIRSAQELRHVMRAEKMRTQFGWADGDSKFIVGDREIGIEGTFHSPPSSVTRALADHMHPAGTLEKWKEVFALYGRKGLENAAFAASTAFGAPLLKFSGQRGAIINLVNSHSGTGKTTALHMCNSVWGHPERLCAKKDDTFNSKVFKIGVFNNLPITFDEMSNTDPRQLSELVYLMTQGTGKDRMKASSNELRLNLTTWQTIALCSSNHSFYEKLESIKETPQGEIMRIIEYPFPYSDVIDTELGKEMFDHQLMENYGHAGDIYARFLVERYEEVKDGYLAVQAMVDRDLKLTQRERFWSAVIAANITGLRIAKRLQLIDWNIARIYDWACKMIDELRNTTVPPIDVDENIIGHFLLTRIDHILVVNDSVDKRTKLQEVPLMEPRQEVMVRYEPDTQKVFIAIPAFRQYCNDRNIGYNETIKKLKAKGVLLRTGNKAMTKGMKINIPPVRAMELDATHSDLSALIDIAERAESKSNESSGS
jgi:hypothetical protein